MKIWIVKAQCGLFISRKYSVFGSAKYGLSYMHVRMPVLAYSNKVLWMYHDCETVVVCLCVSRFHV